jgi:hypothetical protein
LALKLLQGSAKQPARAEELLAQGFEIVSGRMPNDKELQMLQSLLFEQFKHYAAHPELAASALSDKASALPKGVSVDVAAAWTSVCRVLLNMYETVTRI